MMSSYPIIGLCQPFFGSEPDDSDNPMMAVMGTMSGGGMMPGGGPDMSKVYKQEQEGLEMIPHEFSWTTSRWSSCANGERSAGRNRSPRRSYSADAAYGS